MHLLPNTHARCLLGVALVWTCHSTAFAQMVPYRSWHSGGVCMHGPDCSCAPRRELYGYYPPTWRRWPTAFPTAATKPPPETINSPPATEPTPKKPSSQPKSQLDESFSTPDEMGPEPGPAPSMTPPSDDRPVQPRREPSRDEGPPPMPTAPETAPPLDSFPVPPSAVRPPDIEDSPPTMPTDDPFKDEPPQPPRSSEPDAPRSELPSAPTEKRISENKVAPGWRVTANEHNAPRSASSVEAITSEEPALLPVAPSAEAGTPNQLQTNGLQKQNPLRLTSAPRASQVVRAAHWTQDEPKAPSEEPVRRRNPLRGN